MKKLILFLLTSLSIYAQQVPDAPGLEFVCELRVKLKPAMIVGETALGTRRIIPIIGGTVEGPNIKAEIINGGADWQTLRPDGVTELVAHYQFKTDDGELIYIKNSGIRVASAEVAQRMAAGELVPGSEYYFRAVPKFEANRNGKYAWLNDALFICTGEKMPNDVSIKVWKVL